MEIEVDKVWRVWGTVKELTLFFEIRNSLHWQHWLSNEKPFGVMLDKSKGGDMFTVADPNHLKKRGFKCSHLPYPKAATQSWRSHTNEHAACML